MKKTQIMRATKYLLLIIDDNGNPSAISVTDDMESARLDAAPFKKEREKYRPMIQALELESDTEQIFDTDGIDD